MVLIDQLLIIIIHTSFFSFIIFELFVLLMIDIEMLLQSLITLQIAIG